MESLIRDIVVIGTALGLIFALAALLLQRPGRLRLVVGSLFLLSSISFLPPLLHLNETSGAKAFLVSGRVGIFLIGPFYLLYAHLTLNSRFAFRPVHLLHFAHFPVILTAAFLLRNTAIASLVNSTPNATRLYGLLSALHLAAYLILSCVLAIRNGRMSANAKSNSQWMYLLGISALYLSGVLLFLIGLTVAHTVMHLAAVWLTFSLVVHFVLWLRNLIHASEPDRAGADRQRKLPPNFDRNKAGSEITLLMERDKLYLDEELTLETLALESRIPSYMLSALLNEHFKKNFSTFINDYRVQASMDMLLAEPDRTVLSVGLAVGFNSKSSFYNAFQRYSGITPQEHRERNSGGKPNDA